MTAHSTEAMTQAKIDDLEYELEKVRVSMETVDGMIKEYRELKKEHDIEGSNVLLKLIQNGTLTTLDEGLQYMMIVQVSNDFVTELEYVRQRLNDDLMKFKAQLNEERKHLTHLVNEREWAEALSAMNADPFNEELADELIRVAKATGRDVENAKMSIFQARREINSNYKFNDGA